MLLTEQQLKRKVDKIVKQTLRENAQNEHWLKWALLGGLGWYFWPQIKQSLSGMMPEMPNTPNMPSLPSPQANPSPETQPSQDSSSQETEEDMNDNVANPTVDPKKEQVNDAPHNHRQEEARPHCMRYNRNQAYQFNPFMMQYMSPEEYYMMQMMQNNNNMYTHGHNHHRH